MGRKKKKGRVPILYLICNDNFHCSRYDSPVESIQQRKQKDRIEESVENGEDDFKRYEGSELDKEENGSRTFPRVSRDSYQ